MGVYDTPEGREAALRRTHLLFVLAVGGRLRANLNAMRNRWHNNFGHEFTPDDCSFEACQDATRALVEWEELLSGPPEPAP